MLPQEMTLHIRTCENANASRGNILFELSTCIAGAVDADSFNLYQVDGLELVKFELRRENGDLGDNGEEEEER